VDKLLPIESFYTIGTFMEFIEKLLMPSLIIQNEKIIALEVWPYSMDMLHDCEYSFNSNFTSHWYYHMYDNNIALFMHMKEDDEDSEDDMGFPGMSNNNIRVDITVAAITFKSFFVDMDDNVANNVGTYLECIDNLVKAQQARIQEQENTKKERIKLSQSGNKQD
jgi:hypothetical protein